MTDRMAGKVSEEIPNDHPAMRQARHIVEEHIRIYGQMVSHPDILKREIAKAILRHSAAEDMRERCAKVAEEQARGSEEKESSVGKETDPPRLSPVASREGN